MRNRFEYSNYIEARASLSDLDRQSAEEPAINDTIVSGLTSLDEVVNN